MKLRLSWINRIKAMLKNKKKQKSYGFKWRTFRATLVSIKYFWYVVLSDIFLLTLVKNHDFMRTHTHVYNIHQILLKIK